jgi:hypothetical protein
MGAAQYRRLNEELIVADRADHLAVDVDAILTNTGLTATAPAWVACSSRKSIVRCCVAMRRTQQTSVAASNGPFTVCVADGGERAAAFGNGQSDAERPIVGRNSGKQRACTGPPLTLAPRTGRAVLARPVYDYRSALAQEAAIRDTDGVGTRRTRPAVGRTSPASNTTGSDFLV